MDFSTSEKIRELEDKIKHVADKRADLDSAHKKALKKIKDLKETNKIISEISDRYAAQRVRFMRENINLKSDLRNLQDAHRSVIRAYTICEKDKNSYLSKSNDLSYKLSNAQSRNTDLCKINDDMVKTLDAQALEVKLMGDKLEKCMESKVKLADERNSALWERAGFKVEAESLREENNRLKVANESLRGANESLRGTNKILGHENKTFREANEFLKTDLHANYCNLALSAEDPRLTEIRETYRSYLDSNMFNAYERSIAKIKLVELLNNLVK